ncbi:MAG: hypothetical protein M3228_02420 [Actinomycetota bacterium]|nr:hypothetical protein [Actinomycetota bacterium]
MRAHHPGHRARSAQRLRNAKADTAYSTGVLGDLLAVFSDEASVRALALDFTAWPT